MDLTIMEQDPKLGIFVPILGLSDYPIEPQVGDCMSVPERGVLWDGKFHDGLVLRSVRVVQRELPTPGFGKGLTLYVEEV